MNLILPFPPTVNHYWKRGRGRTYITAQGKAYAWEVAAIVKQARFKAPDGFLSMTVMLYPPDNLVRDVDNYNKALLDSLVKAGAIKDDSLIKRLTVEMCEKRAGGAVEISIKPMSSMTR